MEVIAQTPHEDICLAELPIIWLAHLLANGFEHESNTILPGYLCELTRGFLDVEFVFAGAAYTDGAVIANGEWFVVFRFTSQPLAFS